MESVSKANLPLWVWAHRFVGCGNPQPERVSRLIVFVSMQIRPTRCLEFRSPSTDGGTSMMICHEFVPKGGTRSSLG